jgi:hypothetical protein
MEDSTLPVPVGASQAIIAQGTKSDEATARAIATLTAHRASTSDEVNVRLLRKSIFGREEQLSRAEAWEFLNKAERHLDPLPWEQLHAVWDLSPVMSQTQIGAHASLSFRDEAGRDHQFKADPKSVLSSLWVWANFLFMIYSWPRSQAAWFLLTGEPPILLPITVNGCQGVAGPMTSTVTVTVPAYARGESVARALEMARRQLLGRRRGPLALARHAMTEFVDQQFEGQDKRPEWPEVWRRWNNFAPSQWRLRGRERRYPSWRAMLDAYRREKETRRELKDRRAIARERETRARSASRGRTDPQAQRAGRPSADARALNQPISTTAQRRSPARRRGA